jgi:hypothetical protein
VGARLDGSIATTDTAKARVTAVVANGGTTIKYTLLWENGTGVTPTTPMTRLYSRNVSAATPAGTGQTLVFTVNAKWNAGAANWSKDAAGSYARKFEIGTSKVLTYVKSDTINTPWLDSDSETFDGSNWTSFDQITDAALTTALTRFSGSIQLGERAVDSAVPASYTSARLVTQPALSQNTTLVSFSEYTLLWARTVSCERCSINRQDRAY